MSNSPLFSVIIPTYNRATDVLRAISSANSQSFRDFEILVVDDGSTDATPSMIADCGVDLRYFRKPNGGVASARNLGIRESNGEWIAWLDSDDFYFPSKLERHLDAIASFPDIPFFFSNSVLFDTTAPEVNDAPASIACDNGITVFDDPFDAILSPLYKLYMPAIVMKRDLFETYGSFSESMSVLEDTDVVFRMAQHVRFGYLPDVLVGINDTPSRIRLTAKSDSARHVRAQLSLPLFCAAYASYSGSRANSRKIRHAIGHFLLEISLFSCLEALYYHARRQALDALCFAGRLRDLGLAVLVGLAPRLCSLLWRARRHRKTASESGQ